MPENETISLKDILVRIKEESGVDPNDVPNGEQCVWYGPPGGNDPLQLIQVRVAHEFKLFKQHKVIAIFHDEDEFRVYTLLDGQPDPKAPLLAAPRCTHLSTHGPVYFMEILPLDAFVTAVATDWSLLAYDMTPVERARVQIGTYVRENEDAIKAGTMSFEDLADDIESGEYEDEEEEDDKTPAAAPPVPGAPNPGVS
jgi:hypothetical protein